MVIFKYLLNNYPAIYTCSKKNISPLIYASVTGKLDYLKLLIKFYHTPIEPFLDRNLNIAFYFAALKSHWNLVKYFLDIGYSIQYSWEVDTGGFYLYYEDLLTIVAKNDDLEGLKFLYKNNFIYNGIKSIGYFIAIMNSKKLIKYLKANYKKEIRNIFIGLVNVGNIEEVEKMLPGGVNLNKIEHDKTLLDEIISRKKTFFMEVSSHRYYTSKPKKFYFNEKLFTEMIDLLKKYGAKKRIDLYH